MLQLLASKQHPGAEQDVGRVAVDHREQQVIELESHRSEVADYVSDGVPRVPGFEHESRDRHCHRFVRLIISLQLGAFSEKGYCRPEHCCGNGCEHDERQKTTHLRQSDLMVAAGGWKGVKTSSEYLQSSFYRASDSANSGWVFDWFQIPMVRAIFSEFAAT